MPVIPVNRAVDPKRIIRKNGGPRRRKGTRGRWPTKKLPAKTYLSGPFAFGRSRMILMPS
jgi:hypothetical protein